MIITRKATCHPDKKHYAKSFCEECYHKIQYKQHPERYRTSATKWTKANPEFMLLKSARQRAKRSGIEFSLNAKDIIIPATCPVLGIPLVPFSGKFAHNSASIDRVDNTKGYTKDNILIVSFRANSLKKDATISELKQVSDFYNSLQSSLTDGKPR